MVPPVAATLAQATTLSAVLQPCSSGETQSSSSETEAVTQKIGPTASFKVIWFTFSPSCGRKGCKCSPLPVSKGRLMFLSPWARREIHKTNDTASFEIQLPGSQRNSVVMFLSWMDIHKLSSVEEKFPDVVNPTSLIDVLHLASRWENPRYENEVRRGIIRWVDTSKMTLQIPNSRGQVAEFVRKIMVLKHLTLIKLNALPQLDKVFNTDRETALASMKVLQDEYKKLPRRMRDGKVRSCVMDWKDELLLPEE